MKIYILSIIVSFFCCAYALEDYTAALQEIKILLQQKKFQQALDLGRTIIQEQPYNQKAQLYIAISLFELNQPAQAEKIFKSLADEQISHSLIHVYLAKIAQKNKQKNNAI